ncbi:curli assembly protein CsgF [Pseudoroseomonas globiformis]|uniref:Curli production assembly/transport component CsgF n=1 Tax=Teichococcus globiformis TaxID=2307229 RepID=A0ABV7FV23_9PROT
MVTTLALGTVLGGVAPATARDLVYQPVNPSFGGNPLNGSYLLGLAGANNFRYSESPEAKKQRREQTALNGGTDPASQFERQITSSLLSQVAATVGQQILGENARDSGTFNVGGTRVDFRRTGGQITIDITEAATGGRTNIQIPVPSF